MEVINFINKYGYVITQTFNSYNNLLLCSDDEKYEPEIGGYGWSCFNAADFIKNLFKFKNGEKITEITLDNFKNNFSTNKAYFFEIYNHEFYLFYFDEKIYCADYYAEFGRDKFDFKIKTKEEVFEYISGEIIGNNITNKKFLDFVGIPKHEKISGICNIESITVFEILHYPDLKSLLQTIKESFNFKKVVQEYKDNQRPVKRSKEQEDFIQDFIKNNPELFARAENYDIETDIEGKLANYYTWLEWLDNFIANDLSGQ